MKMGRVYINMLVNLKCPVGKLFFVPTPFR